MDFRIVNGFAMFLSAMMSIVVLANANIMGSVMWMGLSIVNGWLAFQVSKLPTRKEVKPRAT